MAETNPNTEEKEPGFLAENKKLIVAVIVIILMLVFIFRNMHDVTFYPIFFKVEMPMVVVILTFFGIGAISVWIYSHFGKKELKRKLREAEKKLKQLGEKLP